MADSPLTRPSLLVGIRDARDGEAWSQFVALYAPLVYGHARKHGLQDADAADLTQDVLKAVAGAVHRLDYDPRRGSFRQDTVRNGGVDVVGSAFFERLGHGDQRTTGDREVIDEQHVLVAHVADDFQHDREIL